ncbi:MAG TPA: AAA family ATPase [Kofleriaceae bacterium]|nr:AAA family ATPase [Kofleriaceae bacterium]
MTATTPTTLPVTRAADLADVPTTRRWLVEDLWGDEAVGIVGGEPKCCKSFLALDLAVAVASGAPCMRRFAVARPGRVLLFAAEDALHVVRQRLAGIARAAGRELADLDVQVITAPTVRLDVERDRDALTETVATLRPRLLVLDPFVRLHRIDENISGEVAPLLAYLRELQRRYHVAVVLVHHARKGGARMRAGQALRGSSEFHAWGDSNLYLRRHGDQLTLSVEHRAAASISNVHLVLDTADTAIALRTIEHCATSAEGAVPATTPDLSLEQRLLDHLAAATMPITATALRKLCQVRNTALHHALAALVEDGQVRKDRTGYALAR